LVLEINRTLIPQLPFADVNGYYLDQPGNLSETYGFLFGGNSTIYANLDGGGGSLVNVQTQQTSFQALAMIGPQTGGAGASV
jgi:hypothetical protein